jgi:hypothetical protein
MPAGYAESCLEIPSSDSFTESYLASVHIISYFSNINFNIIHQFMAYIFQSLSNSLTEKSYEVVSPINATYCGVSPKSRNI